MKGMKQKDKKDFLQMCIHACTSKGDAVQALLLPKEMVYALLSNTSKKDKIAFKKIMDTLPSNSSDLEKQLDKSYQRLKDHYLPIVLDIRDNKSILN